ncbi:YgiQ family radical SAM protein [Selenomonadales bacterium OttesenSCG-928-I06]|nr:YgiQ family radical SAM protein [Selenomonadales bacterium OttesenSCG-928-I06]
MKQNNNFLPITREDMEKLGWEQLDFLFISGDAYVDHPSFGPAIISRILEKYGFKVGIIPQPNWRIQDDFKKMGKPKLGVLISAGNLDSMLSKYTANKKYRSQDSYSPGGKAGLRPERATIVYANTVKQIWKDVPVIIGGIEASLRRFAHYDYWSDNVRRSILIDSNADLLIYGMGEAPIKELAAKLSGGSKINEIKDIRGTCYSVQSKEEIDKLSECLFLPDYEKVKESKVQFAQAFKDIYLEQDPIRGKPLVQKNGEKYVVSNTPSLPLTQKELDEIYDLDYQRTYHPIYEKDGGVPAIEEVKFSLLSQRGCYGGCSFCAIHAHQGRIIQNRSHESIIKEAEKLTNLADFKGYIHDVGGPTANFRIPACDIQAEKGTCKNRQCLFPNPCKNLKVDHNDYLKLLRALRKIPKVKKVFIRSGIRYDYIVASKDQTFLRELCEHHVSGQLKVAPEHVSPKVISLMGKSSKKIYLKFMDDFKRVNKELNKEQYLVPYLMSSHPGSGLKEAIELAEFVRDLKYHPEQVQDFIPTPGSLSTCMYYTGINPLTGEKVYTPKDPHEKMLQRALIQYRNPKNYHLVYEALIKAGRQDLIGYEPKCLIRPKHKTSIPKKEINVKNPKKRKLSPARNKTKK